MDITTDTKQLYELSFHLVATTEEGAVAAAADAIRNTITKHGGAVVREQQPERFQLAYTIVRKMGGRNEKHSSSFFGFMFFEAYPDSAQVINEGLKEIKDLLRYLLIAVPREALAPKQRHTADVKPKKAAPVSTPSADAPKMTKEAMDQEIEKLVVE